MSSDRTVMSAGQRASLALPALGAVVVLVAMIFATSAGPGGPSASDLPLLVGFGAWNVLPYLGLGACLVLVARFAPRAWPLLLVGAVAFVAFGVWSAIAILRSESSTAALGFVTIPGALLLSLGVLMLAVVIVHLVANRLAEHGPPPAR